MPVWTAQRTLLLVGEGYHEAAFLQHVKQLYAPRGCGLAVTIKNARGKGAKHVIDWTIRQSANTAYDSVAAMLDTDTDWNATVAKRARQKKICVLTCDPCFDAVLLRLLDLPAVGDARTLKRTLAPHLGNDPTDHRNYVDRFSRASLEDGRERELVLDTLLRLF